MKQKVVDELLDLNAAARFTETLGLPRNRETIRRAIKCGRIPFELRGGKYFVQAADVRAYLRTVRRGPSLNPEQLARRIRVDLARLGASVRAGTVSAPRDPARLISPFNEERRFAPAPRGRCKKKITGEAR